MNKVHQELISSPLLFTNGFSPLWCREERLCIKISCSTGKLQFPPHVCRWKSPSTIHDSSSPLSLLSFGLFPRLVQKNSLGGRWVLHRVEVERTATFSGVQSCPPGQADASVSPEGHFGDQGDGPLGRLSRSAWKVSSSSQGMGKDPWLPPQGGQCGGRESRQL